MGSGSGTARGSKYRRGPPPAFADKPRSHDPLRAKLRAARRSVQQALHKEAEGVLRCWDRVEEEVRRCFAEHQRSSGPRGLEEAQSQSMLRAATLVRDSTQFGVAVRRAQALGFRTRALADALEDLLTREEAEGLWCCLSTALLEADCVSLACWLEEARAKDLDVPSEVLEFWLDAVGAAGVAQAESRRSSNAMWEYQGVLETRVAEAHARGDRRELLGLISEAKRFGADAGSAEAALISLEADSEEATSSHRGARHRGDRGRTAEDDIDPGLDGLNGFGRMSMDAELRKLGKDLEGAQSQEEMLRVLRELGARSSARARTEGSKASSGAHAGVDANAGHGGESPRTRLARALKETRAAPRTERRPSKPRDRPSRAEDGGIGAQRRHASQEYPGAWSGAARERVRPPEGAEESRGTAGRAEADEGREEEDEAPPVRRPPPTLSRAEALEILGLSGDASEEDVRRAYKRAALRWHPDRQHNHERQEEATRTFQRIRAAFELLRGGTGA